MDDAALLLAIDTCEYLFLTGIGEPEANWLRLVIEEGQVTGEPRRVDLGHGRSIEGVRAIEVMPHSQQFELVWDHYISYAVHNESCQSRDDSEAWSGNLLRRYSRSKFLCSPPWGWLYWGATASVEHGSTPQKGRPACAGLLLLYFALPWLATASAALRAASGSPR